MNASGERERERERGRLRGRGGESKEPVAMFLGVNRAMTQSAESRDEPATRIPSRCRIWFRPIAIILACAAWPRTGHVVGRPIAASPRFSLTS